MTVCAMSYETTRPLTFRFSSVTSSSLAFFSELPIHSLSERLGNDRLNELVETIESVIRSRLLAQGPSSISLITFRKPSDIEHVPLDKVRLYTDCEFIVFYSFFPSLTNW